MSKTNPQFLARINNGKLEIQDKNALQIWLGTFKNGDLIAVSVKRVSNRRTPAQNNAMHLYHTLVSDVLNAAGLTIEKVVKNFTMEHEWTPALVKELLWREAQRFATGKESSTELNKSGDINNTYDIMNRFLAKLKIPSIPFPSADAQAQAAGKAVEQFAKLTK